MYHGQTVTWPPNGDAWRVKNSQNLGDQMRSTLQCGTAGLWYVGAPRPNPIENDNFARLRSALQEWTENLWRDGYVNSIGIAETLTSWSCVPGQTNPEQIDPTRRYVVAPRGHAAYRWSWWTDGSSVYNAGPPP